MILYQAKLTAEPASIIAITARPLARGLGFSGMQTYRVSVRYALGSGEVRTHRGVVQGAGDRELQVMGYQMDGHTVLVSLGPAAARRGTLRQAAVVDRFVLPLGLQAWGVTQVEAVDLDLQAVCRAGRPGVSVRGAVRLGLQTPGAVFPMGIPFLRYVAVPVDPGLYWRVLGGITGLRLQVEPGGWIHGELEVALRCEGRVPHGSEAAHGEIRLVRELSGQVIRLRAEPIAPGTALVEGAVAADLYWVDQEGQARWTGRELPLSTLMDLEGLEACDRVEVEGAVSQVQLQGQGRYPRLQAAVNLSATGLRPTFVQQGADWYRMERLVGTGAQALLLEAGLDQGPAPQGSAYDEALVPMSCPEQGWQALEASVADLPPGPAAGMPRWQVQVQVGGTPAGGDPLPRPLEGSAGVRLPGDEDWTQLPQQVQGMAVAGLRRVEPQGVTVGTRLAWGGALPVTEGPRPGAGPKPGVGTRHQVELDLPGPVSRVLAVQVSPKVQALVALEGAPAGVRLFLVEGEGRHKASRVTVYPQVVGKRWRLCLVLEP